MATEATASRSWASVAASPLTVATVLVVGLVAHAALAVIASPSIDELVTRPRGAAGRRPAIGASNVGLRAAVSGADRACWLEDSIGRAYELAKMINALLVTLAGVPVYLWARRLVSPAYALLALGLFLLLPAQLYAGTLMTENAFLPVFLLATFAIALALERPTLLRQALALAAIVLACAIRIQGLVLVLILLTAIAVMGRDRLRRFGPTFAAVVGAALIYVIVNLARGEPLSQVLGAYRPVASTHYSVGDALVWVVRHFAELGLSVALLPVFALIVMLGVARSSTVAERAFLAVAGASFLWLPIQSGIFASRFAHRIEERTMLYAQPRCCWRSGSGSRVASLGLATSSRSPPRCRWPCSPRFRWRRFSDTTRSRTRSGSFRCWRCARRRGWAPSTRSSGAGPRSWSGCSSCRATRHASSYRSRSLSSSPPRPRSSSGRSCTSHGPFGLPSRRGRRQAGSTGPSAATHALPSSSLHSSTPSPCGRRSSGTEA